MSEAPRVFASYSHDSKEHKQWVAELASTLRHNGIDVVLDQWELGLGDDIPGFMEAGITSADRVLVICTPTYVAKADSGQGGVGYEKMIVTAELVADLGTNKFIPVIKSGEGDCPLPKCLGTRFFVDFRDEAAFDENLDLLLREIHKEPKQRVTLHRIAARKHGY